jgi:SAM-dependent methyltransferase
MQQVGGPSRPETGAATRPGAQWRPARVVRPCGAILTGMASGGAQRVSEHTESVQDAYDSSYREFDTPLMRSVRKQAYGEDIGQNSWVSAQEVLEDARLLDLSTSSRLLDLGSGPCGPLTWLIAKTGCTGTGLELSPAALAVGAARAHALGIESSFSAQVADINDPLPCASASFDAAMAIDVLIHVRDRARLYAEIARVLRPGGRCLLSDAGVITGAVSNIEILGRSPYGHTQFVVPGWNERLLKTAGLRLLHSEDRTESVLRNASGRLAAMHAHRDELNALSGVATFEKQRQYLDTVIELSRRRAISRIAYLVAAPGATSAPVERTGPPA